MSEACSFEITIKVGNHEYMADYFPGTIEEDGSFDILPGLRISIDNAPYGLGEKCHINVADAIYGEVEYSKEYKGLQEKFEKQAMEIGQHFIDYGTY